MAYNFVPLAGGIRRTDGWRAEVLIEQNRRAGTDVVVQPSAFYGSVGATRYSGAAQGIVASSA
jgi:hypothetical protein